MRRADRLFQLLHLLRARRILTGRQLAGELGVSTRTVYRDVADLQGSGVPIQGEAGVGYRLERGFELPPLTFTSAELEGLVLGARIVAAWGDPELASAVGGAMARIEAALPEGLRRVLLDTALFAPGFPRAAEMARHVALMRRGISEHRVLHFRYTRADGEESERDARPLGLYFWGQKWTLAAWCELRRDYRSFRPDRMREPELLARTFEADGEVSLAEFLRRMDEREARGAPASAAG
jgi:predicted DNA-binding transcriptional regulator YafY